MPLCETDQVPLTGKMLVIAYGNPLREDDGVAWRVAGELERCAPDLPLLVAVQLLPEMATAIGQADTVFFVDACIDLPAGAVRESAVAAAEASLWDVHEMTPASLLAAARSLCGRLPTRALMLTVGGERWGFGEELSPAVRDAVPRVVERILQFAEASRA